jgi:hypothetical protein
MRWPALLYRCLRALGYRVRYAACRQAEPQYFASCRLGVNDSRQCVQDRSAVLGLHPSEQSACLRPWLQICRTGRSQPAHSYVCQSSKLLPTGNIFQYRVPLCCRSHGARRDSLSSSATPFAGSFATQLSQYGSSTRKLPNGPRQLRGKRVTRLGYRISFSQR